MQKKQFNQGEIIIRQGDQGLSFFRLEKGSVRVYATENGNEIPLTELKPGDFFGEMAVLEAYPRAASIQALEDGTVVTEIPGSEIDTYFTEEPDKILELFRYMSGRLRDLTDQYNEACAVKESLEASAEKTESLKARIRNVLSGFFKGEDNGISAETERVIAGADYTKGYSKEVLSYPKGTVIFREGEPGRCIYAIHWGSVGIYSGYGTPDQKQLTQLMPGQFFGEMGMIEDTVRSATAVSMEADTAVEVITQDDLADLFKNNPPKVDMILKNLSYRLRRLTGEYTKLQAEISAKQG